MGGGGRLCVCISTAAVTCAFLYGNVGAPLVLRRVIRRGVACDSSSYSVGVKKKSPPSHPPPRPDYRPRSTANLDDSSPPPEEVSETVFALVVAPGRNNNKIRIV